MKHTPLAIVLCALISVAGCGEDATITSGKDNEARTEAVSTHPVTPVDYLTKHVVADGVMFQPEVARVDGDALVSTGVPGFMMFGPYVALARGEYHVTVKGSIPSAMHGTSGVRFDAVSGGATETHGEHFVSADIATSDTIAEFDIAVPEGVEDFELRAEVTEGVYVRIESYQIVKTQD